MTVTDVSRQSCAVVVCSSDNTYDVARQVIPSHSKFWPDCPFPRFVLKTFASGEILPSGWGLLAAGEASGWRSELLTGLSLLPKTIKHVILFLDDFLLLETVNTNRVVAEVDRAVKDMAGYLRFKPVERSIWMRALAKCFPADGQYQMKLTEPYYSSLQVALWEKEHLTRMLSRDGSIWAFEHQHDSRVAHRAVRGQPLINYLHVVEKGRWLPYAPSLFRRAGLNFVQGSRSIYGTWYGFTHAVRKIRFDLIGYGVARLRWWLASSD